MKEGWLFSVQLFCCIERRRVLNFVVGPLKTGTFSGDGSLVEKKKAKRQA